MSEEEEEAQAAERDTALQVKSRVYNDPCEAIIEKVHLEALKAVEKVFTDPTLGDKPWAEVNIRVKSGLYLAGKAMERAQNREAGRREFGLLVMQGKIKDKGEWEKMAQAVDVKVIPKEEKP